MQHQLRHEQQHGGNLVGHTFGGVEMAGIESYHHVAPGGVGRIEIITADCETLQTDAEDLALHAVLHPVVVMLENLVERVFEQFAVHIAVDSYVLAAVVYPRVHDTGVLLGLADSL